MSGTNGNFGVGEGRIDRRARGRRYPDHQDEQSGLGCLALALERLPHRILLVIAGRPLRVWYANAAARSGLGEGPLRLRQNLLVTPDSEAGWRLLGAFRHVLVRGPGYPQMVSLASEAGDWAPVDVRVDALDVGPALGAPVPRLLMVEIEEKPSLDVALQSLCPVRSELESAVQTTKMRAACKARERRSPCPSH